MYTRMDGVGIKYSGTYDGERLRPLARRSSRLLKQGYDTLVYFNNDAEAYAVENAWELGRLVNDLVR